MSEVAGRHRHRGGRSVRPSWPILRAALLGVAVAGVFVLALGAFLAAGDPTPAPTWCGR